MKSQINIELIRSESKKIEEILDASGLTDDEKYIMLTVLAGGIKLLLKPSELRGVYRAIEQMIIRQHRNGSEVRIEYIKKDGFE